MTAPIVAVIAAPAGVPSPTRRTELTVVVVSGWPAIVYPPTANCAPLKVTAPAPLSTVTVPGVPWKIAKPFAAHGAFTVPATFVHASLPGGAGPVSQVPVPP